MTPEIRLQQIFSQACWTAPAANVLADALIAARMAAQHALDDQSNRTIAGQVTYLIAILQRQADQSAHVVATNFPQVRGLCAEDAIEALEDEIKRNRIDPAVIRALSVWRMTDILLGSYRLYETVVVIPHVVVVRIYDQTRRMAQALARTATGRGARRLREALAVRVQP